MKNVSFASACALLLPLACSTMHGASYRGRSETPRARAEMIGEAPSIPYGFERLGRLHARCVLTPGFREISDERLSDVDCSFDRLTWAMRERAAEVGGELLIGRRCFADETERRKRVNMRCEAELARAEKVDTGRIATGAPSRPAPSAKEVARIDEPSAESAWLVTVDFLPTQATTYTRRARHYDSVAELATMPLSHVALGNVITRCESRCSVDVLRHGLRVAAGRLGASDLVDVRCFETDDSRACTGTAAIAEVDPTLNANAR